MLDIEELRKKIETTKTEIAKRRDDLRALVNELEDFVLNIDDGIEGLNFGLAELKVAVDTLSEQI